MSETVTAVLGDVERYEGTGKNGKPYTKYTFKDGNQQPIGATFSGALGLIGIGLIGKRVEVDLTPNTNPQYAPDVAAVREAPEAKPQSNGSGEDVDWDSLERRTFRSMAWAQAISASLHTAKSDETPKQTFERVKPLAHAIYLDVCGEFAEAPASMGPPLSKNDEDIPF
jgi:hypothetical protein